MTQRRLPVKQLVILSICRFAEPIALTSVLPYLPEMIESFGVPENDIARWAGLTSAIFSICQCLTGIPWGAASDRFGRKPIILIGLFNTMVMMLVWGFSTSLPMAMTARAIQGLSNGNVGILRTMVAELCPWKELQPRAFSIMPLVYTVGAIIGPTMGGALSNPLRVDPKKPRGDKFLERFPYALPNLVASACFIIGILSGFLFLKETLETKRDEPDYGLMLGNRITNYIRRTFNIKYPHKTLPEREPLLGSKGKPVNDVESAHSKPAKPAPEIFEEKPAFLDVLTYQTSLNLVVYTLLALYTLAFDQLIPVFMHHPAMSIDDPRVSLPFKFAGGFGIDSRRIGLLFTGFSISSMLSQFFLFPPVARKLGVLTCLRIVFLVFPVIFFITPFTSLLPTQTSKEVAMLILMCIRGVCGTFAFPTSTILLTNSAKSLKTLGTLNGLATSISAVGRAAGPATGGGTFTVGVKHGYVILPFWILSAIALIASIPTWWLEEGEGFGEDPDSDANSVLSPTASSASISEEEEDGRFIQANPEDEDAIATESEYGEPTNLLSRSSTRNSEALESVEDLSFSDEEARPHHDRSGMSQTRSHSQRRARSRSRTVVRRSSVPIGMGVGFRRLSSNLGNAGLGGTSWGGVQG